MPGRKRIVGTSAAPRKGRFYSAAPTAEEILRRLPKVRAGKSSTLYVDIGEDVSYWVVGYSSQPSDDWVPKVSDQSLANAAAAMWIYLQEHSLLP